MLNRQFWFEVAAYVLAFVGLVCIWNASQSFVDAVVGLNRSAITSALGLFADSYAAKARMALTALHAEQMILLLEAVFVTRLILRGAIGMITGKGA